MRTAARKETLGAIAAVFLVLLLFGCGDGNSSAFVDDTAIDKTTDSQIARKGTAVTVNNGQKGETISVSLVSWRDLPFQTVKHQAYDYSCGSAAVATLMSYTYSFPISEKEVFEEMFARGDQDKIRQEGFSMLDMSNYLNAHGLEAKVYKITEKAVETSKIPFIALVNNKGYNHFVVVKTVGGERVLVGDPNTGNTEYSQSEFRKIWNGLALIVVNNASKAHAAFGDQREWRFARAHAPVLDGQNEGIEAAARAPLSWQIAPTGANLLPAATVGTVATSTIGGGL